MSSKTDYRDKRVEEWGMPEWEEFVRDLREEMRRKGRESICDRGRPGRLIAWWGEEGKSCPNRPSRNTAWVEIHYYENYRIYFLAFWVPFTRCIHVDVEESEQRHRICVELREKLKRFAQDHKWECVVDEPDEFIKPHTEEEFGTTSGAVFCKTTKQNCWLAETNGRLDMGKTVENLLKAEEVVRCVFEDYLLWSG